LEVWQESVWPERSAIGLEHGGQWVGFLEGGGGVEGEGALLATLKRSGI